MESTVPPAYRTGFCAVVLTGGTGVRLGGADKASLELDGLPLLEHALAATALADETVVVGEPAETSRPVRWTREEPAGGGPAAGLLAGLDALPERCELVMALAVDMPRVTAETVGRLVEAVAAGGPAYDGGLLVDDTGHRQMLCGVYRRSALLRVRPGPGAESGLSMRRLIAPLTLESVPARGLEPRDVDTWEDLRVLRGG